MRACELNEFLFEPLRESSDCSDAYCSWSSGFTITLMAVLKYQSESRTEEAAEKCW